MLKDKKLGIKVLCFALGVFINALGIDLITKSDLGTSQISSISYVASLKFNWLSFGMSTFLLNAIFMVMQVFILKGKINLKLLLQLPVSYLLGFFINMNMSILRFFQPTNLMTETISLVLGCVILGLGISIEVAPDIVKIPGEGIVATMSKVYGISFGKVKMLFDMTLIILAAILSLILFHRIEGIGIGTVVSALMVGKCVNIFNRLLEPTYDNLSH